MLKIVKRKNKNKATICNKLQLVSISLFPYPINISHNNSIITPETPPNEEIPTVKQLTGMCTEMNLPIKLTANKAHIP